MQDVSPFPPLLVKASAGTGKTYTLSNRFIKLLAAGEEPDNILAATFTKKAAGEIRERILQRLAGAALSSEASARLSNDIELQLDQSKVQEILANLVSKQHRMNITTLDGFFRRIAASFSLELGLTPAWSLADPETDHELIQSVIENLCSSGHASELAEIMYSISAKSSLFGLIYTSAVKLYEYYRQSDAPAWLWIKELQAPSDDILQKSAEKLQGVQLPLTSKGKEDGNWRKTLNTLLSDLNNKDWESVAAKGFVNKIVSGSPCFHGTEIPSEIQDILEPVIQKVKAVVLNELKSRNQSTYELLKLFDAEYQKMRVATNTLNFADINFQLQSALKRLETEIIYYRLDTSIKHLLLDEFQDTSFGQWAIIKPIAAEILSQSGLERSFFCVGDVKQAIYGWRGGISAIFDSLEKTWKQLSVKQQDTSYRCAQPVLDCVNAAFNNMLDCPLLSKKHADKKSAMENWLNGFTSHQSLAKDKDAGYASLEMMGEDDSDRLFDKVVELVIELHARRPDFKIAILTRSNDTIGEILATFAKHPEAPLVSEEGGNPLTDVVSVRACMALLHLLDHPSDTVAAYHVAQSPLGDILGYKHWRDIAVTSNFCDEIRKRVITQGFGQFFTDIADKLRPISNLREQRRMNQLAEIGFSFQDWSCARFSDFADIIKNRRVEDPSSTQVRIMTIHASKGLEFDAVILPELSDPLIKVDSSILMLHDDFAAHPKYVSRGIKKDLYAFEPRLQKMYQESINCSIQDALSVLYVAMTRAKRELYMLIPYTKEDTESLSCATLLKSALSGAEEGILYSVGAKLPRTNQSSVEHGESVHIPTIDISVKRSCPKLQIKRPSELEGAGVHSLDNVLGRDTHALHLGGLLHNLMEKTTWLDETNLEFETWQRDVDPLYTKTELEEAWRLYQRAMSFKSVKQLLSRSRYPMGQPEIFCEQRFSISEENNVMLLGAFDRLVAVSQNGLYARAEVIDFKTDFIADKLGKRLEDKIEYYRPQLLAYQRAAVRFLNIPQEAVTLTLLFVRTGDVVSI